MLKRAANLLLAVPIGIVGGAFCGGAILSFAFLTPTNKAAYWTWTPSVLRWGLLYGGLNGAVVVPVAYLVLLQKIGLKKPLLPALVSTLVGGLLGAILGPGWAVLTGILGFLAGLAFVASRMTSASMNESPIAIPQRHEPGKNQRVAFTVRLGLRLLGTLFLVAIVFLYFLFGGIHRPVLYRLPANYQGWVVIEYEVSDCPQLKTEGLYIVIPVGPSGDGCTSSGSPLQVWRYTRYQSVGADGSYAEIHETGWGQGGRIWAGSFADKQSSIPYPQEQFFVGTESDLHNSWKDRPKPWNYKRR